MRKLLTLVAALALVPIVSGPALAQISTIGVSGGFSFARIAGDVDLDYRTGFSVGAHAQIGLTDVWGVQPGLSYVQKGGVDQPFQIIDAMTGEVLAAPDQDIKLTYLEFSVPLTLKLSVQSATVKPRLYAGPFLGLELSCRAKLENFEQAPETVDCSDTVDLGAEGTLDPAFAETTSLDLGVLIGGGAAFGRGSGTFLLDLRYALGITNINSREGLTEPVRNSRNLQILIGYAYSFSP